MVAVAGDVSLTVPVIVSDPPESGSWATVSGLVPANSTLMAEMAVETMTVPEPSSNTARLPLTHVAEGPAVELSCQEFVAVQSVPSVEFQK
jgi:hypothetical protein